MTGGPMTGGQLDDVTERVWRLLTEGLQIDVPTVDTDLIETGALDSLALVELLFRAEREFGVAVSLDGVDLESFRSVRTIGEMLREQAELQGRPPS